MPPEDKEKLENVEKLKSKLFRPSYKTKIEYHDDLVTRKKIDAPEVWAKIAEHRKNISNFFTKSSAFKKFFFFSLAFFVLSLFYVTYMFFWGGNVVSNENIEISIFGNTFTAGGEELPLNIEIVNKNSSALELVDLVVEYPRGSVGDLTQDTERQRVSFGSIPSGGIKNENITIVLFGEQGSIRPVKVSVEYRIEGSNSIFLKEKLYEVSINSTPINLLVNAPREVTTNQEFILDITTSFNASRAVADTILKLDYPLGFEYISAEPSPDYGNNIWSLKELPPGEEKNIKITGKMVDVFDGEEKTFHIMSGTQSKSDKSQIEVVFNSVAHTLLIQKPFIEALLYVNNLYNKEYAANPKTTVGGSIRWTNNSGTKINDLVIKAKLSGNALNRKSIQSSGGFYDSANNVIIWDKNSQEKFSEVDIGAGGSLQFTFASIPIYSASSGMLVDPVINIEVSVSGRQSGQGNFVKELFNSETKVVKIISEPSFTAKALYFLGPFQNVGPIPPKVEQETTYTIVWTLTNTSNDISNAQVRSSLPPWVKFLDSVSPLSEDVSHNSATREIVWNAGSLPKGTGITGGKKEVAFQISFKPSLSQLESIPILINEAIFTGHDDFANVNVKSSKSLITTALNRFDTEFVGDGATVVE